MNQRGNDNRLFIIDIANPKDVEERVGEIEGVELYDLDSLCEISENNLKKRLSEVSKVEKMIEREIELFKKILNRQRVERLVTMIYQHGSRIREEEIKRALHHIEKGRAPEEVLDDFSRAVLAKTYHPLTKILRNTDVHLLDSLLLHFEKEFDGHNSSNAVRNKGSQIEER